MEKTGLNGLILVLWLFALAVPASGFGSKPKANEICYQGHCFDVEIVTKPVDMARGLQQRSSLPVDAGMLFVFPQMGRHSFWMKDTLIPLDIIWMDYAHKVVYIQRDTPPCTHDPCTVYTPSVDAIYVLELNAHRAQDCQIQVGNQLEFHIMDIR